MIHAIKFQIIVLVLAISFSVFAQNPVANLKGISDPHIRVFNDTVYLFSGHDSHHDDKTWVMKDWRVFSTTNLLDWKQETTISPKDNYMADNSSDCWASDAAIRNGKYYFYFSDRKRGIGVMCSDSPAGSYVDALGKPLVSPMHDPTILIDDDKNKTPYLIYGDKEGGGFHVAKLNDDMISLAEKPKPIIINGKEWQAAPQWMDKNYIFKNNGTYYLSWGRDYATSKNIYGPYECVGSVGQGHHLDEFAHGSFFWWKGQFYHIWCYYIRPGYKFRESIITYCHFDDEGKITTDTGFLDKHFENGVGQYNASWPKIEAEWYYEISGGIKKKGNRTDSFVLTDIEDGNWVRFNNVKFENSYKQFEAKLAFQGKSGSLEIRTGNSMGEVLGKVSLDSKSGQQTVSYHLNAPVRGTKNIYLKFVGTENSVLELDWFRFKE